MKKGLGKGLGALISSAETDNSGICELRINELEPNSDQPRKKFDDEKLNQLSQSIKEHGIVQPIIVKYNDGVYKIVAGERRWRAARIAGLQTVPVLIKDLSSKEIMEIALIENIQREDLNPIEEAEAYEKLIADFKLTQEEISKTVGKSRSAIANSVRLLNLDKKIREMVIENYISSGHARALLAIDDVQRQLEISKEIISKNLNVRETEKLIKNINKTKEIKTKSKDEQIIEIEDKLKSLFGTKVELQSNNKKGKIMIEYYSNEELDRILDLLKIK